MKEKPIRNEEIIPEEENFNDMYDIAKAVTKVHTKHATLNEDFTIANLKPEILENNLIIYIKENINIMVAITNYLNVTTKETIKDPITGKEKEIIIEWDKKYLEMTRELLMDEIITLTNLSRADKGLVINAILKYIMSQGNQPQIPNIEENTQTKKGILNKLNPFAKKKEE